MDTKKTGTFYSYLTEQSKIAQKSINQIERDLGYPRNALHNYKNGQEQSATRLLDVANYFGVTPASLLGRVEGVECYKSNISVYFYNLNFYQKSELAAVVNNWLVNEFINK